MFIAKNFRFMATPFFSSQRRTASNFSGKTCMRACVCVRCDLVGNTQNRLFFFFIVSAQFFFFF